MSVIYTMVVSLEEWVMTTSFLLSFTTSGPGLGPRLLSKILEKITCCSNWNSSLNGFYLYVDCEK